ncbi:thioredoxin family protein [Deferrisoma sp.]
MRPWFPLFAALLLGACATGGHMAHHGTAHQRVEGSLASDIAIPFYSLEEGKRLAAEQKRPIIVDFYAPEGCSRCDRFAKHIYNNPEIGRYITENFVLVRINLMGNMTRDEIALGRKYDYNYDCLLVFLDYRGEVIEDLSGKRMCFADFIEPEWFKQYLARAVEENRRRVAGGSS